MKKATSNNIAKIRKRKGMTQQQLADLLGVHWITISKLERGVMQITGGWLERLAASLKVSAAEIWGTTKAREVEVSGHIYEGLRVGEYEPGFMAAIGFEGESDPTAAWFEVSDDSLGPFFHKGDLIEFSWIMNEDVEKLVGRVCLIRTTNDELTIGILNRRIDDRSVELQFFRAFSPQVVEFSDVAMFTAVYIQWPEAKTKANK